jgi:hypothetical protein
MAKRLADPRFRQRVVPVKRPVRQKKVVVDDGAG